MKKFNWLFWGVVVLEFFLFTAVCLSFLKKEKGEDNRYLVEVNRMMRGMEEQGGFSMPILQEEGVIREAAFLDREALEKADEAAAFFLKRNDCEIHLEPLIVENEFLGVVRFDHVRERRNSGLFFQTAAVLLFSACLTLLVLFFVRERILKPFHRLQELPYELSKGRLGMELEESKERYFGKFLWGLGMLRDSLRASQTKNLKLEREKKMMLLSLSHDIKTPLNAIKLYASALKEDLYADAEEQREAAASILKHSGEIEDLMKEIVKGSSEELTAIEVNMGEFYLKEAVERLREYYEPKCKMVMTEFVISDYEDHLLKGDEDKLFEVLENLMENAFKYGDGKQIGVSFYVEEDCQLICVASTGNPVREEELLHLFDSFYRGSNTEQKEGNGLGLYICREIMRKMEGEIFAQRSEEGMRFYVVVPLA